MPLLFLPIILIIVGIVLVLVIGFSFFIGIALLHILIWPVLIGLLIWWLVRRQSGHTSRSRRHDHRDWQEYIKPGPKPAQHVKEESHHERQAHHDDWSDF
ncbi:hypothetical protein [Lacticaseibacillus camelliae]|nr:hypothetical protein [Lacticaseibacillus camelliae]